jgi:hypothetical protein
MKTASEELAVRSQRLKPRSPVLLVSRDINLQNKAEFANMPVVEPQTRFELDHDWPMLAVARIPEPGINIVNGFVRCSALLWS